MDSKDDLKRIQGIGPSVEKKLNQAGIQSYAQLAVLHPNAIALILNGMVGFSADRIAEEDWAGQAQGMQAFLTGDPTDQSVNPPGGMHYEVFTVEFLMDDDNQVRRTLIRDVQHQTPTSWAGWDAARFTGFFIENAGLNIPQPVSLGKPEPQTEPVTPLAAPSPKGQSIVDETNSYISGELRLQEMQVKVADLEALPRQIRSERSFAIQLILDLRNVQSSIDQPLDYSAVIFAKPLGAEPRQLLAENDGQIKLADYVDLEIPGLQLSPGAYHLEAFVKLMPSGATLTQMQDLMAMTESGIIHVY